MIHRTAPGRTHRHSPPATGRSALLTVFLILILAMAQSSRAASITVNPSTARTGQSVTASVTTFFTSKPTCVMQVNFGDGSGTVNIPVSNCTITGTNHICTDSTSHAYSQVGTFTVQTQTRACSEPQGQASTTVRIVARETTLDEGFVGIEYQYRFDDPRSRYQVIAGTLPRGLKIVRASLQGIPEREGRYRFQIRATSSSGATTDLWYNLRILKARLRVTVTPQRQQIARNRAGTFRLTWNFSADQPLQDVIESSRGIFLAGSRQIGTTSTRLSAPMTNGQGQVTEMVQVPLSVVLAAQRMGIDEIRYQRTFTARYMDAATTSSTAFAVGTGFTLTSIRIYFTDGQPGHKTESAKKFVKRNQRGIHAAVDIRYQGAGILKGYWQADDRILARVVRTLPFADSRTLTLTLPANPPLPTQSIGSHRLRFVVTNPPMDIAFPQVIYVVTGEELSSLHPITLLSPKSGAEIVSAGLAFTWKPKNSITLYKIEFFQENRQDKNEPFFTALSKKSAYRVPARVLSTRFTPGQSYSWRVQGLDRLHNPVAASKTWTFSLSRKTSMVAGQILILTAAAVEPATLLPRAVMDRYDLKITRAIPLAGLNRQLVILSTSGDPAQVSRRLREELNFPETGIQPDFLYSTLGGVDEHQNLETLIRFLKIQPPGGGDRIRVAVIDTGVDLDHPDLRDQTISHANFISSPYRGELHGTAVAGIIAAADNGQGTAGIAPRASIIALRGCEQVAPDRAEGRCSSSSLLQALDRAATDQVDLVNMSLGAQISDPLLTQALNTLSHQGIVIMAPAGNDPDQTDLAFPASHPQVVSVAGQTDSGRLLPNEKVASQADLILPAQMLLVPIPGDRTTFMSGTSMAAAAATGLLAGLNPDPLLVGTCRSQGHLISCLEATLSASQ